jgi:hypothetical protein
MKLSPNKTQKEYIMKFKPLASLFAAVVAVASVTPAFAGSSAVPSKTVAPVVEEESLWTATLSAGWDSKYIFRGVNVLNDEGLFWTDLNATIYGFNLGAWYANGYDSDYTEINLYASYTLELDQVSLTAGYVFYAYPDDDAEETSEVFATISTSALGFVTPSLTYVYDFDEIDGSYIEAKLSSSIPLIEDTLSIDPWASISYGIDYNFDGDGWNNVVVGVAVPWKVNEVITVSGYVAGSFPLDDLEDNGEDDEFVGGVKVSFTY